MEFLGGILLGVAALVVLAAIGLTTVAALAIMSVLGIVTEISFKRLFFLSFGLGLLAPLLVAIGVGITLNDEEVQRELAAEMRNTLPQAEEFRGGLDEALPRFQELREQLRNGEIEPDEFERELEQLIEESSGARIDLDLRETAEGGNTLRIESN